MHFCEKPRMRVSACITAVKVPHRALVNQGSCSGICSYTPWACLLCRNNTASVKSQWIFSIGFLPLPRALRLNAKRKFIGDIVVSSKYMIRLYVCRWRQIVLKTIKTFLVHMQHPGTPATASIVLVMNHLFLPPF